MRITDKIAGTIGLVAVLSALCFVQPAQAQFNFDSFLGNYIGTGSNEKLAPNQGFVRSNIDSAQARFESELSAGISSGRISGYEASELRARLGHIASMEASFMAGGGFTFGEVQTLMNELTSLQDRLNTAIASGNQFNSGFNGQYGWNSNPLNGSLYNSNQFNGGLWNANRFNNGQWNGFTAGTVSGAEIDRIQAQLATRISGGLNDRSLTRREADNLRKQLDNIARLEANMRVSGGGLTRSEADKLRDRLQNTRSQLVRDLNDRQQAGRFFRSY